MGEAKALFEALAAKSPDNPVAYARLGVIHRMEKHPALAKKQFEKALSLNPQLMDVLSHIVSLYAENKDYDAAIAFCDAHRARVGDVPELQAVIYSLQGELYLRKQNMDAAEKAYQGAIEKNPNYMGPYFALARLYLSGKKADKAIAQYEAGIVKNPKQPGLNLMLGTIYDAKKQFDLSEKYYRAELAINPDSVPSMNNLAYLLAENKKDLDGALTLAQAAKEKALKIRGLWIRWGGSIIRRISTIVLLASFPKASKKCPIAPWYFITLGWRICEKGTYPMPRYSLKAR